MEKTKLIKYYKINRLDIIKYNDMSILLFQSTTNIFTIYKSIDNMTYIDLQLTYNDVTSNILNNVTFHL